MRTYRNLIILTLFFISCNHNQQLGDDILFKEIHRPYATMSPTIKGLLEVNDNQINKNDINDFWTNVQEKGTPLVEKDSLDNCFKYLTFIYQDSSDNIEVSFEVFGIYEEYRFEDMKLRQLKNTDIYYRTYKVPNDICFSYKFNIYDSLSGNRRKLLDKYNLNRIPHRDEYSYSYSVIDLRQNEYDWNIGKEKTPNGKLDTIKYHVKTLNADRNIYVYLPPDYDNQRAISYPAIYLFDAFIYLNRVEVPVILDNLIKEGKIKPMIAVFFDTHRQTREVILPLNSTFKTEFVKDFIPFIRKTYNVSHNPSDNIIGGMSYGGLAAGYIGFYHPELFGNVLSQSGSFWRGLELSDSQGEWIREDWLINQYFINDKKQLKLYLDWGLQENFCLGSNRRMVRVLNQKKYDFLFTEFNGWHDWSNSRKTFPNGLLYLLDNE
jgi:enterochelin esterase family protein